MIGALADTFRAEGELWLNKRRCDGLATEARRIGILFQDALLFDHFSVGHNLQLALPAEIRGAARQSEVEQALARAGMPGFASRDPATLSGGQRARVSLLRALLARPQALLLDEPFNRLDAELRADFRQWVFAEIDRLAIPAVLVTHDSGISRRADAVLILPPGRQIPPNLRYRKEIPLSGAENEPSSFYRRAFR